MPKDSNLLPPWSQALLRAARMGQVFRPPAPPVEEDKEPGEDEDGDGDIEPGFIATKWGVVPRHLEGPEPEFLAKRRKGLSSLYGAVSGAVGASNQMRKTKIKKIDNEGHEYVLEALVPEGQSVQGEVAAEETTLSEAPAPGTVVEGVGVVNAEGVVIAGDQIQPTPPRRKPPPPKRKAKGPGRGRKKKVAFASGPNGAVPSRDLNGPSSRVVGEEGAGITNSGSDQPTGDGDVEMGEDSMLQDGEEGSEDDEEGEEGEEGDREDGELSPSPAAAAASPLQQPAEPGSEPTQRQSPMEPDPAILEVQPKRDPSSSPDLPLAAAQNLQPPVIHIQPAESVELPEIVPVPEPHIVEPQVTPFIEPVSTESPFEATEPAVAEGPPELVSVEPPPQTTVPAVEAELPVEHNPLDGLVEPKATTNEQADSILHFADGEEDLLGSLERHLDKRS